MAIADGHGLPVAVRTESASPAENTLVAATLEARLIAEVPERLVGDKAYDSDGLDCELMEGFGRNDRAPSKGAPNRHQNPGRPQSETIPPEMESGTLICLVEQLPPPGGPLGIPCPELSRLRPLGLPRYPLALFMRWLLAGRGR